MFDLKVPATNPVDRTTLGVEVDCRVEARLWVSEPKCCMSTFAVILGRVVPLASNSNAYCTSISLRMENLMIWDGLESFFR